MSAPVRLRNARVGLALHRLGAPGSAPATGEGRSTAGRAGPAAPPLLLLHALGGRARDWAALAPDRTWPGAVWALDFAGHGASDRLTGGFYSPELFASDADAALARIGAPLVVVGAGIGAYAGLLLAGARHDEVIALGLLPGAGLDGGGTRPSWNELQRALSPVSSAAGRVTRPTEGFDPRAAAADDAARPPAYARSYLERVERTVLACEQLPRWWPRDVRAERVEGSLEPLLAALRP